MGSFTDKEIEYLNSQRLGRLATLNADGSPHLTVVGFRHNPELDTVDIGGRGMGNSKKFRDVIRDGRVAFVVDDVQPPWKPRGVEIRGRAEAIPDGEPIRPGFANEIIRIHPTHIVGWGIESEAYQPNSRKVERLSVGVWQAVIRPPLSH
jgi:pyridoxamine 5'-phosphate oxidase family protein